MSTNKQSSFELIVVGSFCLEIDLCRYEKYVHEMDSHFPSKEKAHIFVLSLKQGFVYLIKVLSMVQTSDLNH